ncbi:MAG: nucleotidyltransferase domain-containing protein [Leptospira sp.]|nr:nucleotidyltransferase domain-containing protein [Leptospira sp.]
MSKELSEIFEILNHDLASMDLSFLGIFGSRARGDNTEQSDYDILFEDTEAFRKKFRGFNRAYRLEVVKLELEKKLGKHVDLVNKRTLGTIGSKYILKDLVNT